MPELYNDNLRYNDTQRGVIYYSEEKRLSDQDAENTRDADRVVEFALNNISGSIINSQGHSHLIAHNEQEKGYISQDMNDKRNLGLKIGDFMARAFSLPSHSVYSCGGINFTGSFIGDRDWEWKRPNNLMPINHVYVLRAPIRYCIADPNNFAYWLNKNKQTF